MALNGPTLALSGVYRPSGAFLTGSPGQVIAKYWIALYGIPQNIPNLGKGPWKKSSNLSMRQATPWNC